MAQTDVAKKAPVLHATFLVLNLSEHLSTDCREYTTQGWLGRSRSSNVYLPVSIQLSRR